MGGAAILPASPTLANETRVRLTNANSPHDAHTPPQSGRQAMLLLRTAALGLPPRRAVHSVASTGFTNQAQVYEKTRPSYPPTALAHVLQLVCCNGPNATPRVLDLAAGGGKFTRLLASQPGLLVSAVEPVAAMRAVFHAVLPSVPCVEGTAASIPFDADTFDAVTIAQAFHWMDQIEALRDIRRVLKPGAPLVLLWNMESRRLPWVAELRDVYEKYDLNIPQYRHGHWKKVFASAEGQRLFPGALSTTFFDQNMVVTKTQAWERVLSKSYISSLPPAEQAIVKAKVQEVLDKHDAAFHIGEEKGARQWLETEVTYVRASS